MLDAIRSSLTTVTSFVQRKILAKIGPSFQRSLNFVLVRVGALGSIILSIAQAALLFVLLVASLLVLLLKCLWSTKLAEGLCRAVPVVARYTRVLIGDMVTLMSSSR